MCLPPEDLLAFHKHIKNQILSWLALLATSLKPCAVAIILIVQMEKIRHQESKVVTEQVHDGRVRRSGSFPNSLFFSHKIMLLSLNWDLLHPLNSWVSHSQHPLPWLPCSVTVLFPIFPLSSTTLCIQPVCFALAPYLANQHFYIWLFMGLLHPECLFILICTQFHFAKLTIEKSTIS